MTREFVAWAVGVPGRLFGGWGAPGWVRELAWWALLVLLGYVLARLLGALLWAAVQLAGPALVVLLRALLVVLQALLLVPDFLLASLFRRATGRAPTVVHRYGQGVLAVAGWADRGVRRLPARLELVLWRGRVVGRLLVIVVLVLAWNAASCAATPTGLVCQPGLAHLAGWLWPA
ncbi:hypothetical protein Athai_46080 [Actinocatenispora thailandica]|uniref:Uncharacterized protein n=1 Tax=Actinocatenispora thailandica TaxID=227318 RepID=A0A7R7DSM0_9ACTN|nr:hypothetical protein [Actinocatenispora thailandica]BCJ37105.1 hypothetical protein Athai_46080 [Actinocatenispora thailandica]